MQHLEAPDGRRLAYRDSRAEGGPDGPAVLCLAGLTRNGRDFDALAAALAERYRVIRLDSRGRGGSEHADDPMAEYQIPVELGDALALVSHLGLTRLAVVGTSRGGILGMGLAATQPGLVAALVLNDIGARIETAGLLTIRDYVGRQPELPDFDAAAEALMSANRAAFPGVPRARWLTHARAVFDDDGGRPVLSYDPRLAEPVAASIDPDAPHVDLWPMVEALGDLPILLIRGANSDILSADTAAEMAARCPRLTRVEIADRGHVPFLDEAPAVAAIRAHLGAHLGEGA